MGWFSPFWEKWLLRRSRDGCGWTLLFWVLFSTSWAVPGVFCKCGGRRKTAVQFNFSRSQEYWGHLHSLSAWVHLGFIACSASICQTCTVRLQVLAKPGSPGREGVEVSEDECLTQQQMLGLSLPSVQVQLCTQRTWEKAVCSETSEGWRWRSVQGLCSAVQLSHHWSR